MTIINATMLMGVKSRFEEDKRRKIWNMEEKDALSLYTGVTTEEDRKKGMIKWRNRGNIQTSKNNNSGKRITDYVARIRPKTTTE